MTRKLKLSNFRQYLKSLFYKIIGWTDDSDIETRKALARFDYLNQLCLVSLCGGQKQEYDKPMTRKVWIGNWIARLSVIFTFVRVTLFMIFQENDQMDLYLANFLPEDIQPMKTSILVLFDITFFILFMLREYTHYIESAGCFESLRIYHEIRIHGVAYGPLMMNKRCSLLFNKICHLFMVNGIRLLIFSCIYASSFSITLRLYFPSTYSTKMHIFFLVLHIPIEVISLIILFSALISIGIYLWVSVAWLTCRLDSIIDKIQYYLSKPPLSQYELRQINELMIKVLNYIEESNGRIRYLLLYLDGMIAVEADIILLFALIYKLFPEFISKLFSVGGMLVHFFLVIGTYWASRYHVKVLSIHGYYTKLVMNTQAVCPARFKALEIQDRINENQTGIAIGDFGLFTAKFALIFILENINFIMLLTCNINSLVNR